MVTLKEKHEAQQKEALREVLDWAGSQTKLAKILGIDRVAVTAWTKRGRMSATAAERLEEITNGLFSKRRLRPDVVKWWKDGEMQ